MKPRIRVLLFLVFAGVAVCACGNKGDLVLPDPPEHPPEPATQSAPPAQ